MQSLAKITLPGVPRGQRSWTIHDREAFTKGQLMHNLTPGGTDSETLDNMSAVEEMVFQRNLDILHDPKVCVRRHC